MMIWRPIWIGVLLATLSGNCFAHAFWLVPHKGLVSKDDLVAIDLRVGVSWPGERVGRLPGMIETFDLYDAQGKHAVKGRDGAAPVGHFRAGTPGTVVVAMLTHAQAITLPGVEFDKYLVEEGLDQVRSERQTLGIADAPGREQFLRCAKTLVRVNSDSAGFDRVVDLPLELVAVTDPFQLKPGGRFKARLLREGKPVAGVLVRAWAKDDPKHEQQVRTDQDGVVELTLEKTGLWFLSAVQMHSVIEYQADWESIWASLSFEIPTP
ncbi:MULTISPECIES: DUF4198 domain-containing protein [Pseudomonas]|uniref:DUF4198 domain-containing protein n=1 Tax=Pseudomonas TaxID=286 RepID=UPI000996CAC4|nr:MULTISPECIES: DUF4198 domain-containing protein [Pseudomonas]MBK3434659.1 DUF4198 domain-containing protein [Pseudomonas fluorescens]HEE9763103.1 DUF4198 domain-containing protein [Pseudomonas putida]MBJ2204524.1 DUF4198 domain-containing protein [Pseudomonas carnis]MBK3468640.1 DUF4198 domain-containing protein [Pseudomonas sp. MF6776]MBW9241460.1 DUF4198 domain-containing protein [Pseudomonas carnis]